MAQNSIRRRQQQAAINSSSPSITITSPTPGTVWKEGDSMPVDWEYAGKLTGNEMVKVMIRYRTGSIKTATIGYIKLSEKQMAVVLPSLDDMTTLATMQTKLAASKNVFGVIAPPKGTDLSSKNVITLSLEMDGATMAVNNGIGAAGKVRAKVQQAFILKNAVFVAGDAASPSAPAVKQQPAVTAAPTARPAQGPLLQQQQQRTIPASSLIGKSMSDLPNILWPTDSKKPTPTQTSASGDDGTDSDATPAPSPSNVLSVVPPRTVVPVSPAATPLSATARPQDVAPFASPSPTDSAVTTKNNGGWSESDSITNSSYKDVDSNVVRIAVIVGCLFGVAFLGIGIAWWWSRIRDARARKREKVYWDARSQY
ncbi:hypothetical protein HDU97_005176 [Phlyctochytrium planicorne]|nr:hypothetical protein HDU97_005176 [Phlyctochytrium planicorne]